MRFRALVGQISPSKAPRPLAIFHTHLPAGVSLIANSTVNSTVWYTYNLH